MLTSIAVTAAPEHWLSLEAAALLDVNRVRFWNGGSLWMIGTTCPAG